MSSKSKKITLWRKHTAEDLEIALSDNDSDDNKILSDRMITAW